MELPELQAWFQDAITNHSLGDRSDDPPELTPSIEAVIGPSADMTARDRLAVYARMYLTRLIDALSLDFPGVAALLGGENFRVACRGYLADRPSQHFSVNHLGHDFADWMSSSGEPTDFPLACIELAELEWSLVQTFHSEDDTPITADALSSIPPDRILDLRFLAIRALRMFAFDHRTNKYLTAAKARARNDDRNLPRLPPPETARTYLLVHRKGDWVRRRDLDPAAYHLLKELIADRTLGDALEAASAAPGIDPAHLESRIATWFQEWTSWGLFRSIAT